MIPTREALALLVLSTALGWWGTPRAHAQMGSDRQQFLALLKRNENRLTATNLRPAASRPDGRLAQAKGVLAQEELQLGQQLARLNREVLGSPSLARDLALLERQLASDRRQATTNLARVRQLEGLVAQLQRQERVLEQRIANTSGTPLHARLVQEERALRRQEQALGRQLNQLRHEVPINAQQAQRIVQLERLLELQIQRDAKKVQQLDRVLATPFSPNNSINVFGL